MKWIKYKVKDRKYNSRFDYYSFNDGNGGTYYRRKTKKWYILIEKFGHILERAVYRLHRIFGKRNELTEKNRLDAKEYASENVSESEFLDRFSRRSPYTEKPCSTILWWIRKNITFD